jgi:hypothetical protein
MDTTTRLLTLVLGTLLAACAPAPSDADGGIDGTQCTPTTGRDPSAGGTVCTTDAECDSETVGHAAGGCPEGVTICHERAVQCAPDGYCRPRCWRNRDASSDGLGAGPSGDSADTCVYVHASDHSGFWLPGCSAPVACCRTEATVCIAQCN